MRQKFAVQGMTCGGCTSSVTRVLKALPGVSEATVSLTPGGAEVEYDPDQVSAEKIVAAISRAGFEAQTVL
ncbi:Copper-exporting P-type ATPase [Burkholderiales bacterium]|nr:MAG: heavy-metal-associated domain-containing protein [Burkholderiales bacterium]CAG0995773.1 Copper-exporting P-type ATPase [Burkholderiales bacterium]